MGGTWGLGVLWERQVPERNEEKSFNKTTTTNSMYLYTYSCTELEDTTQHGRVFSTESGDDTKKTFYQTTNKNTGIVLWKPVYLYLLAKVLSNNNKTTRGQYNRYVISVTTNLTTVTDKGTRY